MICRICGNDSGNRRHEAREMMYGLRERFPYFQCARCGCLQITEFPADMGKYYPRDYYSFLPAASDAVDLGIKRRLKALRLDHWLGRRTWAGQALAALFGEPWIEDGVLKEMRGRISLGAAVSVLDVGCGNGARLAAWSRYGFAHLVGADPFIKEPMRYRSGVTIHTSLPTDPGGYGLIMMNHSFEHMPNPLEVLQEVAPLLSPVHSVMIALPLSSSEAWERYGVDWVQLDAPRHFFLHSVESMSILADRAGYDILAVVHNSTAFQFWGSEQYARDIPLRDPRSYACGAGEAAVSREQMRLYEEAADRLNRTARGDQASFYLQRRA